MNEVWAGWVEAHELPGSAHLRTVAEILSAPATAEERRAERREEAEAEAKRASAADTADNAAAQGFMARMNGHAPLDPLTAAAAEPPGRDRETAARRRAAIDLLRPHGLQDVVTGFQSGVVFDANMGVLEPPRDVAQQAALDRRYEAERSERLAEERRAIVNRSRAQLAERLQARGRYTFPQTAPTDDDAARRQYERACREIGVALVSYR
jgi:hypothetical protein